MRIFIGVLSVTLLVVQLGFVFFTDLEFLREPSPQSDVSAAGDELAVAPESVEASAKSSAVRIVAPGPLFLGSGVVVNATATHFDVITADHVIEDQAEFAVEWNDPIAPEGVSRMSAEVIKSDSQLDLVLLRVSSTQSMPSHVELASDAIGQSEVSEAWIVDCTRSGFTVVSVVKNVSMQVAKNREDAAPVSYWRVEQKSKPGMSGSALLDRNARLLGIASGNDHTSAYYCGIGALVEFSQRSVDASPAALVSTPN